MLERLVDRLFNIGRYIVGPKAVERIIQTDALVKISDARAEAAQTLIKADAEGQARLIEQSYQLQLAQRSTFPDELSEVDQELVDRARNSIASRAIREQYNVEAILSRAIELANGRAAPEEHVDPVWAEEFYEHASKQSNETAREAWARVLVEEVELPGSISKKTMSALRMLTAEQARAFEAFCTCATEDGAPYVVQNENGGFGSFTFENLRDLEFLSLIRFSDRDFKAFAVSNDATTAAPFYIDVLGVCLTFEVVEKLVSLGYIGQTKESLTLRYFYFTRAGRDLKSALFAGPPSEHYIAELKQDLVSTRVPLIHRSGA